MNGKHFYEKQLPMINNFMKLSTKSLGLWLDETPRKQKFYILKLGLFVKQNVYLWGFVKQNFFMKHHYFINAE